MNDNTCSNSVDSENFKLVHTLLNYRVLGTGTTAIYFQMAILSMHLYTSEFLPTVWFETTSVRSEVWCSTNWVNLALMKAEQFKWPLYKQLVRWSPQ